MSNFGTVVHNFFSGFLGNKKQESKQESKQENNKNPYRTPGGCGQCGG